MSWRASGDDSSDAAWGAASLPPTQPDPLRGTALQSCPSINAPEGASQELPLGLKNNFLEGDGWVE